MMCSTSLELHLQIQRRQAERMPCGTRHEAVDHARANEQQRLHLLHRRLKLEKLCQ